MSTSSLIQFEDKDGNLIGAVLQVPNIIERDQLKGLINTTQDLYYDGRLIQTTLENVLNAAQINDTEQLKKIKIGDDEPSSQAAIFCSGVYSGHQGPVIAVKYREDAIVSIGGDKTTRFWDPLTKTQFQIVQKHDHWVVCLDADDRYVVTGGMDKLVNLYDHKGNHIRTFAKHRNGVTAVKILGDKIISCSRDNTCVVWNIDGRAVASWAHTKPIKALCADETFIITGGADNTIKIYKDLKYFCDLKGHSAQINCIEKHGNFIVSGDDAGHIIVWKDFKLYKRVAHKREVISLSIDPNGFTFASGSFDKTVKLWSIESGENLANYFHVNLVYKVKLLKDMIVSCSKDKMIRIFRISKNKVVSDFVCDDEIYDFDYHEGHLMCGTKSGKVYFFN
ncbi:hypothetical protein ENBRE01_1271 [Enteropsectra breve]|nr:hypothetical protein ENBRE01_1271 [Enteropsectra breve]